MDDKNRQERDPAPSDPKASRPKLPDDEPIYIGIAKDLKDNIFAGHYPVGAFLPTEEQLCQKYEVSRNTVREALRILREENLVSSRRGAGTRVLPPQSADSNFLHAMSINDFQGFEQRWDFRIQTIQLEPIGSDFGRWVGVPGDEEWLAIHGLSRTRGAPHPECWVDMYVHKDFASIGPLIPNHSGPVFTLIEDMFGLQIVELTQEISAELVSRDLAKILEVEPGTPAIVVRRACKTADGRTVEANIETYPASRFRYQVNLHRAKPARELEPHR